MAKHWLISAKVKTGELERKMNKWKIAGISLAGLVVAGWAFVNSPLMMAAMFYFIAPSQSFAEDQRQAAPDYTNPDYWAARPDMQDSADVQPNGFSTDTDASANVAVFFVHPTTYVRSDHWNQPLDHAATNKTTDDTVMRDQASVFNGCCDVYAPRYRQATLFSFSDTSEAKNGQQALAHAYSDVAAAFEQFLQENPERPIVLAGHSQGSHHLDQLIEEQVVGTDVEQRLVAAYPIGFSVDTSNGLPVCQSASQTRCQVTWNTNAEGANVVLAQPGDICVNPLTWTTDAVLAGHEANLGGVTFGASGDIEPGVADARCQDSQLIVSEVRSPNYDFMPFGAGNYHIYDYSFYHMNLRQNVQARVAAFFADQAESTDATLN
jgi:hypothetical protein